ncbi:MAG: EAL domain-containing protein [Erysipelotrichaceae bacterium]
MTSYKTILVVDDNALNRTILTKILSEKYVVIEAENGKEALAILNDHQDNISAIMLDLVMPIMNGYTFLKIMKEDVKFNNLPIIVTTDYNNVESEIKALTLGAWDFVTKPYNPKIIMFRLKNVIDRSQLSALNELKYLNDYDGLTKIYNKRKFYEVTRKMIDGNPEDTFVFMRFDVDRFQLINSFFGAEEGDKLLVYIANEMAKDAKNLSKSTYGRIESDIICVCAIYNKEMIERMVKESKNTLAKFNSNYDIVPSIGIYVIDNINISVEEMYNRATLAAKTCKGNYVDFYAYYDENMSVSLNKEQEITNDMNYALENHQFVIYLQPQYNIHTNLPSGAEVLVRWIHPIKGVLSPNEFIPIFERNGFITKLDFYVWEQACICLQKWKMQGKQPLPISVNVSRVNIYNPNLVDNLFELIKRYEIDPELLNLEVTESAYTDNPVAMKKVVKELQQKGFIVMMDDFGSGYSSLSLLKDIEIDVLKIDMRFLSGTEIVGRGENIIASVIRMAKWLNIPVIAEGAETAQQVDLLRSVGCDYVQGYYFAKPMSVDEYIKTYFPMFTNLNPKLQDRDGYYQYNDLFVSNSKVKLIFNNTVKAAAIYEFYDNDVEIIRVNDAYYSLLGHSDIASKDNNIYKMVGKEYQTHLLNSFQTCAKTHKVVECDYMRRRLNGSDLWIHSKLYFVSKIGNKSIIIGELSDITVRKELNYELRKYREDLISNNLDNNTILIVDDGEINRIILKNILKDKFKFLEAENGEEAIKVLKENENKIDLILLDISMPIMDGKEFLQYKQNLPELDAIPVIMITADDSKQQQITTFSLGANDYLVKPFIPEVVVRRVKNVLESNHRFKEMVKEYNTMSKKVKMDLMTGLMNRASVEKMMEQRLLDTSKEYVMIMLDIDNFKKINDTYGHSYGDKVIGVVAAKLSSMFRKDDIVARMGGDEFAVFFEKTQNIEFIKSKISKFRNQLVGVRIDDIDSEITCSLGIAISSMEINTFEKLYKNADLALYHAKSGGRDNASFFGEETLHGKDEYYLNQAKSIVCNSNRGIYVCDKDTYELQYIDENLSKLCHLESNQCKGKKCYEVVMHQDKPCVACGILKDGETCNRLFHLPNHTNLYLSSGKNINSNGNCEHLEVISEINSLNIKALTGGKA